MSLEKYATEVERQIVAKIVDDALAKGLKLSVYDGAEFTVKRSAERDQILQALCTTGEDYLHARQAVNGERVGWVRLIWGNGCDLISDYSANDATEAWLKDALELSEKFAA